MAKSPLWQDTDFIADCRSAMKKREVMDKWGVSSGLVVDVRKKLGGPRLVRVDAGDIDRVDETFEQDQDGNQKLTKVADRIIPLDEWLDDLRERGFDPEDFTYSIGHSVYQQHTRAGVTKVLYANKFSATKRGKRGDVPEWPLIHPARDPIILNPPKPVGLIHKWGTAVIGADTQIGYDMDEAGNLTPYHDDAAIELLLQVVHLEDPEQTIIAGDIIDLTEQSRWSQEAPFARTTQPALERCRLFAAETRARTGGEIHWIEGNHDKRMQAFMEANAKASMGLRKAGYPDSWPVMSVPNLVGLDEFDVNYVDAYPAGVHWITDGLRVIHGTKVNSKGSTAAQYANEMPHISTIFGHTHRLEVQSKTTFDRAGKIRTMNVNPGCLCRVDGVVPSFHGARHLDGSKATYYEDWQQGVTIVRYLDDGTFYIELVQIDDGRAFYRGQELVAA